MSEMLRVLKSGGRIAFSTWPPELLVGRMFVLVARYQPPPAGVAPPGEWGDPTVVLQRLGTCVRDVEFHRETMTAPALSPQHYRYGLEVTIGPIAKVVAALSSDPERLVKFRAELGTTDRPLLVAQPRASVIPYDACHTASVNLLCEPAALR